MQRSVPSASYYTHFGAFYDGDYQESLRGFLSEARGAIKTPPQSRWIDSICYETMCGECCFRMGNLTEALEHYSSALILFKNFSNWMIRVQFPATLRPAAASARKAVQWGTSTRQSPLAALPASMLLGQGRVDQSTVFQHGGLVQQANLFPVTPQEIVRCTALAMRRRATLLGPVAKYDSLTEELLRALSQPVGPPNHWSECWVSLERGLVLAAAGQEEQAVANLQRAVLAAGEYEHPLTCVALLELGRHALRRGDYENASRFFEEATFAAVNASDFGVLEEAFHCAALTHLLANRPGFFPLLESAAQWAKTKNLRELCTCLLLCGAENYAVMGETRQAAAVLEEVRAALGRRLKNSSGLGARFYYLSATVLFQEKKVSEGNNALKAAMEYMRTGSLRLFQSTLADNMYVQGIVAPRVAVDLFAEVLRDPRPVDWASDPQESLAALVALQPAPLEHWFEAAFQRKDNALALEVADRMRRRRFFASLDFGGRLESLRWLLESPLEALPQQAQVQRQDLLTRYPAYEQLARQSRAVRAKLSEMPLVAEDPVVFREQGHKLTELATLSGQQEAILREIAVRREPALLLFPPLRPVADVQKSLPEKHAVLAFVVTSARGYGFLLNRDRLAAWEIGSPAALSKPIATLLRELGQFQKNSEMPIKDLAEAKWKPQAAQLLDTLLKGSPADFSHPFDELAIVPDGVLWYLPFDALQVTSDGESQSLISRFRMRYAPTVSLATSSGPPRSPAGNAAVVVGKLYPGNEDAVAQTAFEQLARVVPGAVALRSPPPAATSLYRTLFQRLIVLDDLTVPEQDPYGWSPVPIDRGKTNSTLADWLLLPWGGPDVIVLPGYHTAAEESLKRINVGRTASNRDKAASAKATSSERIPGNEMFLSVCGLMANGARTVLLSRWRMGGQTSFDLVREFAQELPHTSPADAWQRAVALAVDTRLNLDAEPRVKRAPTDEPPKAGHPFFWAGYMLLDCGTKAEGAEPAADGPVIKVVKPDRPAETDLPGASEKPASEKRTTKVRAPAAGKKYAPRTPKKPADEAN